MRKGGFKIRILIGIAIVAFAYLKQCGQKEVNLYTGKTQAVSLSPAQEVAIGLQQAPSMAQQHGVHLLVLWKLLKLLLVSTTFLNF